MKTFIVLIAIVALASAKSVPRSSGWGSPANLPSIDIELAAAAAAAATGQASASQALIETTAGNTDGPAYLLSLAGVQALVGQDEEITQVATADKPSGAASSVNVVDVENIAEALDTLEGNLGGAIGASVINAAQSEASGEGSLAAEAESLNVVSEKKY